MWPSPLNTACKIGCVLSFFNYDFTGAFVAFAVALCFICLSSLNMAIGTTPRDGVQNIQSDRVSRFGGVAILTGLITSFLVADQPAEGNLGLLLGAAFPIFFAGFLEDATAKVSAALRLFFGIVSGVMFCFLTGYTLSRSGLSFVDTILEMPIIAIVLTTLAVASFGNAVNIIDGLNGLASLTVIFAFCAIISISHDVSDDSLQFSSLHITFVCIAILLLNFPISRIYIGDSGAYLLGVITSGSVIMLVERNEVVSPFCALLIVVFAFYELMRSIIRRLLVEGGHPFKADRNHLHSYLYIFFLHAQGLKKDPANMVASIVTLVFPLSCCIVAALFYRDSHILLISLITFVVCYETVFYWVSRRIKCLPKFDSKV